MIAYHGSTKIKNEYLEEAQRHEAADSYVKGLYWQEAERRGCNIGCWTREAGGAHESLAAQMGLPEALLHLSDGIFEALPDPYFKTWSRRFADAIPVGSELGGLGPRMLQWIMGDRQWGLVVLAESQDLRQRLGAMAKDFARLAERKASDEAPLEQCRDAEFFRASLAQWKSWDLQSMRDMRAMRAALELWRCRNSSEPKALSRAAWAARAAWSAWEAYTLAQSETFLEILKAS